MSFTPFAVLSIGFSVGASLLLALAFASVYRGLALPWQSRAAGYFMLLGLVMTQVLHARFSLGIDPELISRTYAVVLFLQSVGIYFLLLGVLRPPQQMWHIWEWAVLPGFSGLVRRYRVEAAKKMLIDEPRASVLSVGLSVAIQFLRGVQRVCRCGAGSISQAIQRKFSEN